MLDTNLLRRSPETIVRSLERRGEDSTVVSEFLKVDSQRRRVLHGIDYLRSMRNEASQHIGDVIKQGGDVAEIVLGEKDQYLRELADELSNPETRPRVEQRLREFLTPEVISKALVKVLGELISKYEKEEIELAEPYWRILWGLPNIVSDTVPDGEDETGNVVIREEGERRFYDFELKPHWELSESLGITDFERGAKLSGRMFYALGEAGARLQRAVVQWMLDLHRERHGYEERGVPFLVLGRTMFNSSNLPKFGDALYRDIEGELWLIPTAEVPLTSLHADEVLAPGSLPIKYMAHTPCFRRERAAAGSQVRGLKRLHQFEKVEMYQFVEPEQSPAALDELVEHASDVVRGLGLPFRILQLCSGDLGFASTLSYDVEIWTPASEEWLEVSSCSNCTDFQARRANIRYRREHGARPELVHTLNGSGLALPRVLIAILETYQQADGSVRLPDALVPYMGGQQTLDPI